MSTQDRNPVSAAAAPDKFEQHYRQQLSALVDGELAADEARFMLRRLEHDSELSACQERWQVLGDVMRGQACAPAPLDFTARVRQAVDADARQNGPIVAAPAQQRAARTGWRRWGGGAALAASVAAVALFMAREQLPETNAPTPVIATTAEVAPAPAQPSAPTAADAGNVAGLVAAAPAVAAAVTRRQDAAARRGSATRTQQAARAGTARLAEPQRAIASAPVLPATPALRQDPFATGNGVLHARPWPRSTVAPSLSQGALNASFPAQEQGGATFYPFEPRMPAQGADDAESRRLLPRQ
ncbi:sigma-E factor negative regulatory protein [Stenotrophomonas sp.]|uniref:sigma-E factor negative regulatory protein n=1 Tax=Stenotrophomonas sp. TaxID=69392 RepID=UPI0028AF8703|nr:sigma-E factor negative regulatory protein [Stenotrophomonas sp.]